VIFVILDPFFQIRYEGFKRRVLFHTHYNEYFKENVHMFEACAFLAELTQHIPPKKLQLIRRYGLYSSRIKGAWQSMPYVAERAPAGWKSLHVQQEGTPIAGDFVPSDDANAPDDSPDARTYKQAWARCCQKCMKSIL
jgi:hypothetical protein